MLRYGKIGIFMVMVILVIGVNADLDNQYMALWGIEETNLGHGLIFDGAFLLKINLNIYDDLPPSTASQNHISYEQQNQNA